jgi:hypothetical protein
MLRKIQESRIVFPVLIAGTISVAVLLIFNVAFVQNYSKNVIVSFTRQPPSYDYSCGEPVDGLFIVIRNVGPKDVSDLSVTVTNKLCAGSIPTLPSNIPPHQLIMFYVYSTKPNGTLVITGNETYVSLNF